MTPLILVLAAWTANVDAGPQRPTRREARPARPAAVCSVQTVGSAGAVTVSRRERSYSAAKILSVRFRTKARLRPSEEPNPGSEQPAPSLQLKVYAPNGDLYDVLDASSQHGRRAGPHLLRGEARLPVAGTSIVHSSLYGRWRVVPFLEGGEAPCGQSSSFSIEP